MTDTPWQNKPSIEMFVYFLSFAAEEPMTPVAFRPQLRLMAQYFQKYAEIWDSRPVKAALAEFSLQQAVEKQMRQLSGAPESAPPDPACGAAQFAAARAGDFFAEEDIEIPPAVLCAAKKLLQ